ncbi:MAG: hypothetical protein A3B74_04780 [Candidatus Kerfeldbacteria bacterium RIFCSPHIGHO2_02_FULL_42_14]|uniref:Uncharacterized protein n=1 Tax=Candidatus Kerfeldbacteria bacterium RIFCSPHIGHO2_02_FULL_42_14 TaxID=1798540 RepID=A0A1G2ARK8_9BACT|nr:MAG: hypothetical protein A3B74_04780 [Candidatus Kerfeldbacteria bacterium RIFCSPHIGHO2_02_FULL_42_14]OGY81037.1 MAG: hypothetical protein A3E60_03500 [Candidatus Kerfeldbacteria bacterium RIFCSPHIGHO2_12_FULL_42_13]OGY84854.1 MAG: hypothetical protein A3I91_05145 [Candidatus Kerfeldbacteria bacterium RIFCSPLOWO2_02_FULL_42_19]OGY85657.1 MAG: hypothetical protein A3G01_04785 [Candidatus Kerfeldbacteria bacterium RIFCSPLOWO2_12_FULL_43_9]
MLVVIFLTNTHGIPYQKEKICVKIVFDCCIDATRAIHDFDFFPYRVSFKKVKFSKKFISERQIDPMQTMMPLS